MRTCEICQQPLRGGQERFCSKHCYGQYLRASPNAGNHRKGIPPWNKGLVGYHAGENHWHWQGGRRKHQKGYIEVMRPDHPAANSGGYVMEHRLVMEQHLGRYLTPEERIHHINGDKTDNRIENLQLLANESEHWQIHKPVYRPKKRE